MWMDIGQGYRVDCIQQKAEHCQLHRKKRFKILGSSNTFGRCNVVDCSLFSVRHRLACTTIANLSEGQLSLNVGIISIPPDTYSAATFVSFVSQRLLLAFLPVSRSTICRDHPPNIFLINLFLLGPTHLINLS